MHFAPEAFYTNELVHQRPSTPETCFYIWFLYNFYFTRRHLHLKPFTSSLHTLHQRPLDTRKTFTRETFCNNGSIFFTPDDFYARSTLHQRVFTAEGFYPDPFTPNNFCTRNRLITTGNLLVHFFYKEPLYQKCLTLTLEALYTKAFSQQKTFTPDPFCTKQLLHQKPVN